MQNGFLCERVHWLDARPLGEINLLWKNWFVFDEWKWELCSFRATLTHKHAGRFAWKLSGLTFDPAFQAMKYF